MDNASLRLEQILDDFEETWQSGQPPDLAELMDSVPAESRHRILKELVLVDLEYRWRTFQSGHERGEVAGLPSRPHLKDYAHRFPDLLPADQMPPELVAEEQRVLKRFKKEVPFDQIASICATFHAENGQSAPNFEECLSQVPTAAQPTLMRNLLHQDIESRRDMGETPNADEYSEKFPQLSTVIHEAFEETPNHFKDVSGDGEKTPKIPHRKPAAPLLGEYRLLRELGRGGMGCVYEAIHLKHQHRVALKMLPEVDGPSLHRFKQEFRLAAELNHPNLVGLHAPSRGRSMVPHHGPD